MAKRLSIIIIAIICLLTACSSKITKGEVYNKEFEAAHSDAIMLPIVHTNGKSCYTTMIPIIRHYPDQYIIRIKQYNEDEQDWDTADYYVTAECYDNLNIGDYFEFDSETMKSEPTYTDEERENND